MALGAIGLFTQISSYMQNVWSISTAYVKGKGLFLQNFKVYSSGIRDCAHWGVFSHRVNVFFSDNVC